MSTFAKFLIDKNIINQNQLIEVYVYQEKMAPGLINVISESKLLDRDELVRLVLQSAQTGEHVYNLLLEHDISIAKGVVSLVQEQTPNFIRSIAELDICDEKKLSELYDEFQSHLPFESEEPTTPEAIEETNENMNTSDDVGLSAAALESLRELGMDTEELENSVTHKEEVDDSVATEEEVGLSAAALESLRELGMNTEELEQSVEKKESEKKCDKTLEHKFAYLSYFDDERKNDINKVIDSVQSEIDKDGDYQNLLSSLFKEFHLLRGAAEEDGLQLSERLIAQSERSVATVIESGPNAAAAFAKLKFGFEQALNAIWELREAIVKNGDETSFWKNEKNKKVYVDSVRLLKSSLVAA